MLQSTENIAIQNTKKSVQNLQTWQGNTFCILQLNHYSTITQPNFAINFLPLPKYKINMKHKSSIGIQFLSKDVLNILYFYLSLPCKNP